MLNFSSSVFQIIVNRFVRDYFLDSNLISNIETPLGTYQKVSEIYRLKIEPTYVSIKPSTLTIYLKMSTSGLIEFLKGKYSSKIDFQINLLVNNFENSYADSIFSELQSAIKFDLQNLSLSYNNCLKIVNEVSSTNSITKNLSGINFYGTNHQWTLSGIYKTCYECKDYIDALLNFNTSLSAELNFNTLKGIYKTTYLSI